MPSKLPTDMMIPIPEEVEEVIIEEPPEPVNEDLIFSKKEIKKNTSSEEELQKIEKKETKEELELLITEQNNKPKKKKRGKATKSPEELAAHMEKMRAASLKKRQENKKNKKIKEEQVSIAIQSKAPIEVEKPIIEEYEKPISKPVIEKQRTVPIKKSISTAIQSKAHTSISVEDKLRLTELKLFEYQIREDERNKISSKNVNKAKEIAEKNIQQPNKWGKKSAMSKWANIPEYKTDDPYDIYKIK
jgi:hypothetical protein